MGIQKITIEAFLQLAENLPVLDVRSPGEYTHAHIPGAFSLPLFSDEERKVVGTAYKQKNRETAIKIGLDYFGIKMRAMVEEAEKITHKWKYSNQNGENPKKTVLVHCWRGGMRSAGVAWLLDLYGFKVITLAGGYKAYREWVRARFEKQYPFKVIGGYTGSGKTEVLKQLATSGRKIINLEGLANHKGSAFGALGEEPQPMQEMFENLLAASLHQYEEGTDEIWIEDESHRVGNLNIPIILWTWMRQCPVYFLDIPFEERLDYICTVYGGFEKESLVNATMRIQKRLGGQETRNAINCLLDDDVKGCFRILLTYYDKWYGKGLENRENLAALLNKIACAGVDTGANTQKLLHATTTAEKSL